MPHLDPILEPAIAVLRAWAIKLVEADLIQGAYLFGSAVNKGGQQFESEKSDLDVIVTVDWALLTPDARVEILEALAKEKLELENQLMRLLQRDNAALAITSVVPMTAFEIQNAVHKDGNNSIVTRAAMLDLCTGELQEALNPGADETPLAQPHRSTLQYVQKQRAAHLSRTANGKGGLGVVHKELSDGAPKDLLRHFAVATADLTDGDIDPADTNRGLEEFVTYLRTTPKESSLGPVVREWLGVRMGRGKAGAMPTDHYLFALEAVFDKVRDQYPGAVAALTPQGRAATPATARQAQLPSRFTVSLRDTLAGGAKAIERAIDNARTNISYRYDPGFELVFEEEADVETLLAADSGKLSAKEHRRQKKAFERRARIAALTLEIETGLKHILYYGGLLFPEVAAGKLPRLLQQSMDAYLRHMMAFGATNPGGGWDARHVELYPGPGMSFMFGAETAPGPLGTLAPLRIIPVEERTASFVPELIAALHRREDALERPLAHEELLAFVNVHVWEFGYH